MALMSLHPTSLGREEYLFCLIPALSIIYKGLFDFNKGRTKMLAHMSMKTYTAIDDAVTPN